MTSRIVVVSEAEEELLEARHWYESRRSGLGDEFLAAVNGVISKLAAGDFVSMPLWGLDGHLNVRKLRVKRFPYFVVFIEHADAYWVLAFAHHRRRPGYWRHRSP